MVTVTVCVGSSCHVKGARDMIMYFNDLLNEHRLDSRVELKGSFCMERCGEGINWQIDDEPFTSYNVEDAVRIFEERIIKAFKEDEKRMTVKKKAKGRRQKAKVKKKIKDEG